MTLTCITNGILQDPANDIDGEVRNVWIEDGRVVNAPTDPGRRADKTIDATGMVVMPGGVDMHCHIAGPKVNVARKMMPDDKRTAEPVRRTALTRSGTTGSVPSTFATGYLYAGLGYTTAFDAAIPPLLARHAHEELEDTPIIDKGFYVLMGNNHYLMKQLQENEPERLKSYVGWLLNSTKGFTAKLVNPGGVEVWKSSGGNATSLDSTIDHFDITPRQIINGVATAVDELGLPHPVHIHANNLGVPGNYNTTLDTMNALEGHRGHITHIQFHSYGGDPDDQSTFCSKVPDLVEYVESHPNITVDVGQVMFGNTTSMTGDGPLGYFLHKVMGRKWFSGDTEMETGCGIVPITYKNKSLVHAIQWAIGLEWYLLMQDPWRIAMSTDHPNGSSFRAYPEIIALLMSRDRRREMLARVPGGLKERTTLADLDREYTLNEIAIITRASPARMLGLKNKGHLGIGADADVTIYQPNEDYQRMFELPRYVIRRGEIVVEDGEIRSNAEGRLLHVAPKYDDGAIDNIREWFEKNYTIQFRNYPVDENTLHEREVIGS
ncbi:MAG: formylmethanofuran dehydrogenase subunit A [Planctomycetaceae bacterium]|jgi:formylmethanofuran dehydrogenase subunit A|nr:formylmethanofuran dehydrogenase subunit A [Planctomycetaceae bacterium]MBT6487326.1 formylmethanofuran dehydrogenase subunit A [Planctomycetaceae bacterium]MBT6493040.1 formylmethanofuran dehydrogenase subunit A [Planctomycetaceae bacterium]